ncbi:excalibur calcium-binding domain-containing protein [Actinocorallia longicatena]|uniref:Excalibur calcium-binding domain-containing protein n=1 Tax=Actinocorallia longicatena TaxID=111803 RepID=A0ABP6Q970_9ACTN
MYQSSHQPPRPSGGHRPLLIGCAVLLGLFAMVVACGAVVNGTTPQKPIQYSPAAGPEAATTAPEPSPTSTATSSLPPAPAVDAAARRACAAHVQAVALKAAGWPGKAAAKARAAKAAARASRVGRLAGSPGTTAVLSSWCRLHLPGVKAQPVPEKPKPRPSSASPTPRPATDPRFRTCREANAAGYGDYVRGEDPEYGWYQDRDGDGTVCETR